MTHGFEARGPGGGENVHLRPLPKLVFAYGFSLRKRTTLRRCVAGSVVRFIRHARHIAPGSTLLLWGGDPPPPGVSRGIHVLRVEDGFLRSVGLGAELARPLSWSVDSRGIHFDATQPSDLEHLLQTVQFLPPLLNRAAHLRRRIVASGLTKYNVGQGAWLRPSHARRVILVPGQVESDASLRYGAPAICSNLGLLQAVRRANPDSYVVYKPHPDVRAGLRAEGTGEAEASVWCDEILGDLPMGELLNQVDEVHVMTSLTGFEALLRQKVVVCYGLPFYAGWGLTRDILTLARRTRHLSLDELVAAALLIYPIYFNHSNGACGTPEQALDELCERRDAAPLRVGAMRLLWRQALRLSVGAN